MISAAALLQQVDGGVFAVHVVADFGFHHRLPHGGVGLVTVSLRRSIIG
jgi:hypothetical protein